MDDSSAPAGKRLQGLVERHRKSFEETDPDPLRSQLRTAEQEPDDTAHAAELANTLVHLATLEAVSGDGPPTFDRFDRIEELADSYPGSHRIRAARLAGEALVAATLRGGQVMHSNLADLEALVEDHPDDSTLGIPATVGVRSAILHETRMSDGDDPDAVADQLSYLVEEYPTITGWLVDSPPGDVGESGVPSGTDDAVDREPASPDEEPAGERSGPGEESGGGPDSADGRAEGRTPGTGEGTDGQPAEVDEEADDRPNWEDEATDEKPASADETGGENATGADALARLFNRIASLEVGVPVGVATVWSEATGHTAITLSVLLVFGSLVATGTALTYYSTRVAPGKSGLREGALRSLSKFGLGAGVGGFAYLAYVAIP